MANTEYYVDGTRPDDTGDGLSEANAKKTIAAALALGTGGGNRYNIKSSATYTLTAALAPALAGDVTDGPNTIEGYASAIGDLGTRPTITCATNGVTLVDVGANYLTFRNLTLTHTAATRGRGFFCSAADRTGILWDRVTIDGCSTGIDGDFTVGFGFLRSVVRNCEVKNCTSHGISTASVLVDTCYVHDNTGDGVRRGAHTSGFDITVLDSVLSANGGRNVHWNADVGGVLTVANTVLRNATASNLEVTATTAAVALVLRNNIIYGSADYGIELAADPVAVVQVNNAFRSNTTGNRSANVPAGVGDVTLTGDPWTNAAAHDYSLNSTAGAGAACRAAGFPGALLAGGTGYADIGPLQHQDAAGGGGAGPLVDGRLVR